MKKNTDQLVFLSNHTINSILVLKPFLVTVLMLFTGSLFAQKDVIIKKDSTEIRCKILKEKKSKYTYAFVGLNDKVQKSSILKSLVNKVEYAKYDKNLVENKLFGEEPIADAESEEAVKPYKFTFGIGLSLSNVLEFNSATGPDKKAFSATSALDLGLDYFKEGIRFAMTNELHWTLSVEKSGVDGDNHIRRTTDELITLHDFSFAMGKNNNWNFNLIVKTNTSIFTIYDGGYFDNYNNTGREQAFINPYQVSISPGIKYQPNKYFRLSISPYSMSFYGLTKQDIANTGYYTQTTGSDGNYSLFEYKELGAELNVWYDRKFKKWLEMQYRLGISSNYFTNIADNGLVNGLFITKIKIIKNVGLNHRSILKGDLTQNPFKPYYSQTVLLSYSKTF